MCLCVCGGGGGVSVYVGLKYFLDVQLQFFLNLNATKILLKLLLDLNKTTENRNYYSRCPKSKRYVWKTEQNLVWISDIWAVPFVLSFVYTINVQNPNVWLVESNNLTSEIRTV